MVEQFSIKPEEKMQGEIRDWDMMIAN